MAKLQRIENKKFGRLTVTSFSHMNKSGQSYWNCICECGNKIKTRRNRLTKGATKSCGCLNKEIHSKLLKKYASSKQHKGCGNPMWIGDDVGYNGIHSWLTRNFKKEFCEKCNSKKLIEWALKKGFKHERKRENYLILCRSCHRKYDFDEQKLFKMLQGKLIWCYERKRYNT